MPTDILIRRGEKRRTAKPQEQLMREQQILIKYGNSPLRKELLAKLRRTYVLLTKKKQSSFQQSLPPRKISGSSQARATQDIRQVKRILKGLVAAKEAERWLSAPNALLGGICPADSIKQGKTNQVIEILARLEEGIHV